MYDYDDNQSSLEQLQTQWKSLIKEQKKQLANRRYFKRLRWFLLFALVAGSGYLLDNRPESLSLDKALLALGITWLGFLPSLQYLLDRNRPPMPFFPLVGIFYATSFGLPMFANAKAVSERWSVTSVSITALTIALIGIGGMNIAFFASKFTLWKQVSPIRLPEPYPIGRLLSLLWLLLLSHLTFIYIPSIREIPSIGQFLDPVGYVAYGMFYILFSRSKLPSIQAWILLIVCVPLEVIQRFTSGSLAQIMLLGLFIVIIIFHERKRIPVVFISVTLVFFFIFNSVKAEYRYLVWFGGQSSYLSAIEKAQLFIEIAIKHYQNSDLKSQDKNYLDSSDSVVSRTAHIILFSNVIEDTPTIVPYWGGETYLPLLTSLIPRALLPDKPIDNTGNKFGRRYNYLGSNDFTTSFNLPWIVEMYANLGRWGVLIGMSLVGLLLSFLDQKLNHTRMNSLEFVIGATILFRLIYQESNFSLMTGSVITLSLALYILFRVVLGGRRRAAQRFESSDFQN